MSEPVAEPLIVESLIEESLADEVLGTLELEVPGVLVLVWSELLPDIPVELPLISGLVVSDRDPPFWQPAATKASTASTVLSL